jgi:hypothetical protein
MINKYKDIPIIIMKIKKYQEDSNNHRLSFINYSQKENNNQTTPISEFDNVILSQKDGFFVDPLSYNETSIFQFTEIYPEIFYNSLIKIKE